MGMDLSIYVGVVLRCTNPINKENKDTKRYCPKCAKESKNENFCSHCGTKISTESIVNLKPINFWEILEKTEIDEDLLYLLDPESTKNIHYITFNSDSKPGQIMYTDVDVNQVINPGEVEEKIMYVKTKYGEEIEKLKPFYKSVSVDFIVKSDWR